jgi:hypothetical protein
MRRRGIVFIDEIDKIAASHSNHKDIGGSGVQQALLKILEGAFLAVVFVSLPLASSSDANADSGVDAQGPRLMCRSMGTEGGGRD